MGFAVELYEYWRVHPPTHLILQAVYAKDPPRAGVSEEETRRQISNLFFGEEALPPGALAHGSKMPDRLLELADWADEQVAKMKVH